MRGTNAAAAIKRAAIRSKLTPCLCSGNSPAYNRMSKEVLIQIQYRRCEFFIFYFFDGVLGDFAGALHIIPFRPQAPDFKVPLTRKSITVQYLRKFLVQNADLLFVILYDISLSVALVPRSVAFPQFGFPLSKAALLRSCRQENRDPRPRMAFH
jgi:hypothetical protein